MLTSQSGRAARRGGASTVASRLEIGGAGNAACAAFRIETASSQKKGTYNKIVISLLPQIMFRGQCRCNDGFDSNRFGSGQDRKLFRFKDSEFRVHKAGHLQFSFLFLFPLPKCAIVSPQLLCNTRHCENTPRRERPLRNPSLFTHEDLDPRATGLQLLRLGASLRLRPAFEELKRLGCGQARW